MEKLYEKIKALKPDTALLIYCGVPTLLLILFLVVPQWSMSMTHNYGSETAVRHISGLNLLNGKLVFSRPSNVEILDMTAANGVALGVVYMLSLVGVVALGYTKKIINYKYAVVPMVILFIMLAFGVNISVKNDYLDGCFTGSALGWIEFLVAVAWCVFAYIRNKEDVSL